ncbi:MAG TPA: hypothetical protein VLA19_25570 [Herpetosiphonaceae bacterium]|nr:hypothetical protein [Herpetosiphonaceae bacterium]
MKHDQPFTNLAECWFNGRLIALLNFLPYKYVWCPDDRQPFFEHYQSNRRNPGLIGIFGKRRAKVIQRSLSHIGRLLVHWVALLLRQKVPLRIVCGKGRQVFGNLGAPILAARAPLW